MNAAETAVARSAEWKLGHGVVDQVVVDEHGAHIEALGDRPRLRMVAAPDAGVEPIFGVVGQPHRFIFVAHAHDGEYGAEGLRTHQLHAVIDIGDHRGLEEVAG